MYINPRIVMLQCDYPQNILGDEIILSEDYCGLLPEEARAAGLKLYDVYYGVDPLILYDAKGHIINIWRGGKPSMAEIARVCRNFLQMKQ